LYLIILSKSDHGKTKKIIISIKIFITVNIKRMIYKHITYKSNKYIQVGLESTYGQLILQQYTVLWLVAGSNDKNNNKKKKKKIEIRQSRVNKLCKIMETPKTTNSNARSLL
jgi:hypothetical protein